MTSWRDEFFVTEWTPIGDKGLQYRFEERIRDWRAFVRYLDPFWTNVWVKDPWMTAVPLGCDEQYARLVLFRVVYRVEKMLEGVDIV